MEAFLWRRFLLMFSLMVTPQSTLGECKMRAHTCIDIPRVKEKRVLATMEDGTTHLCEMFTENGGWTVIQRRFKGDTSFYRSFEEYRYGFGDMAGDFWWGLDNMAKITSKGAYELLVTFDFNGRSYYARYYRFRVAKVEDDFMLDVGLFSGNAGDSLKIQNGQKFSTKDKDNDRYSSGSCANTCTGGWWYNSCLDSNLNGTWNSTSFAKGTIWETVTGNYKSVYNIEMKIRLMYPIPFYKN